jgi:hypothetical protein
MPHHRSESDSSLGLGNPGSRYSSQSPGRWAAAGHDLTVIILRQRWGRSVAPAESRHLDYGAPVLCGAFCGPGAQVCRICVAARAVGGRDYRAPGKGRSRAPRVLRRSGYRAVLSGAPQRHISDAQSGVASPRAHRTRLRSEVSALDWVVLAGPLSLLPPLAWAQTEREGS